MGNSALPTGAENLGRCHLNKIAEGEGKKGQNLTEKEELIGQENEK
jgi:hypothetical protein